jgi:hypothetical protein
MRALAYLEWCYVRHNFASIRRSRWRFALWVLWVASLILFGVTRFMRKPSPHQALLGVTHGGAIALAGGVIALGGLAIAVGGSGRIAVFRSPAEALIMSNAGISPLAMAVWLELRKIGGSWTRSLGGFVYAFLFFMPVHAGPLGIARAFIATLLVLVIPQGAGLPAFLIARGRARGPVMFFGFALAALGAVYAAAGLGGRHLWPPLLRATHLDPGGLVRATLLAEPVAFAIPLLLLGTFVAIVALRGNDALPEIYAASNAAFVRQSRGRLKAGAPRSGRRTSAASSESIPTGFRAIVWKDWTGLRRGGGLWLAAMFVVLWTACGVGAALVTVRSNDGQALFTFAFAAAAAMLFWAPFSGSTGLSFELARPLFWLSADSLRARLAAFLFARSWRGGLTFGCAAAAAALVVQRPDFALLAMPLAALAYGALNALGIGFYAVFPNPLDARGPGTLLRLAATFAYLIVPSLAALVAGFAHAGSLGAAIAFALALGFEGWLVLELAAVRFAENGATLGSLSASGR